MTTVFEKCSYEIRHSFRLRGGPLIFYSSLYILCRAAYTFTYHHRRILLQTVFINAYIIYRNATDTNEWVGVQGGPVARVPVDWCSGGPAAVIDRHERRRLRPYKCIRNYIKERALEEIVYRERKGTGIITMDVAFLKKKERNSRRRWRWRWQSGYTSVWCTLKLVGCI